MVTGMMERDPEQRLTAQQALATPWIAGEGLGRTGDPDSFTRFRPYLAHFPPVFPRFLRVFPVSPRRFQRAQNRNPGPRNSVKGAQTPF